ncbi:nucleoside diphosphate kinase homolog 7 [Parasteatoda tepidariorum]|uniref:nucleoside diphosphate kinase homolog 7 n=1 Tax=Parasteatoda tepidariorum TaxID=114398 RepID=UPI00077FB0BB|nr:nucleoside diphosphate kinase 7 [Parasteatoda tepidariorum]
MSAEKYRFKVEWFDSVLKIKREFLLSFYPSDRSIDMFDTISKKLFLRRTVCSNIDISDFFIGSIINVLSRQLMIVGFGDGRTAEKFSQEVELTVLIINESGFSYLGEIISILEINDLNFNHGKIVDKDRLGFSCSSFTEDMKSQFAIFELRGENAINVVRKLVYPDLPIQRQVKASLRELKQHCLAPKDPDVAMKELRLFFPQHKEVHCNTAIYSNSTCCIIKPHALRDKVVGKIIQDIVDSGFKISALEVVSFNVSNASEFLDVYKGVVPEYKDMVAQLMSGPSIALEIISSNMKKTCTEFRTFVGPADPEIARKLRPGTLRAKYGQDKIKNAVHCTDLPEDTNLELEYIFRILAE